MDGIDIELEDHDNVKYPKSAQGGSTESQSGSNSQDDRRANMQAP